VEQNAGFRLAVALAISAAVHVSLVLGIAARPPSAPEAVAPLVARVVADDQGAVSRSTTGPAAAISPARHRAGTKARVATTQASSLPAADPVDALPTHVALSPARSRLPTAVLPVPVDAAWYSTNELDVLPNAVGALRPTRPAVGDDRAGMVVLLVHIDEAGQVEEVSVVTAEPAAEFGEAAVAAVQNAQFTPAQRNGRPVRSRVLMKVLFDPPEDG